MSDTGLLKVDGSRSLLTGIDLPDPPPTRVYISGRLYRLSPTSVPLPPIANVAKLILNWVGPAGRIAKNILFAKLAPTGSSSTSSPTDLTALANQTMASWVTGNIGNSISTTWSLQSVTAKDAGGTSAQGLSSHAAIPGLAGAAAFPPQCAVVISWQIAETYRGGKPRTYLPGVPTSATGTVGDSALTSGYASGVDNEATAFMNSFNAQIPPDGGNFTLGTVSYHTGHSIRPTPLFRTFIDVHCHERLDSQRRRSGRESSFPVTP